MAPSKDVEFSQFVNILCLNCKAWWAQKGESKGGCKRKKGGAHLVQEPIFCIVRNKFFVV